MGEVISFSGLNIYTLGLFVALSFLWGSFVFLKKSAETHFEETAVLDMIVMAAFWGFLFARVGFVLFSSAQFVKHWGRVFMFTEYPGMNRWFALLGFLVAVFYSVRKKRGKIFDYLDVFTLGYFFGVSLMWVLLSLVNFSWQKVLLGFLGLVISTILWRVEKTYRFLDWYKGSKTYARTGFVFGVGTMMTGVLYIIELAITFEKNWQGYGLGTLLLVIGLALLYIRSGRMLEEDFVIIKKWKKVKIK
ncbi:hypothetical protein A2572_00375 [Candidatus Collierbacteria bacterium RIFOXYD1_FULL_40_9]|uniref:Prolipoprotein diacylglyceryl transferase n=1 Tax=Candidatus Collierbacteria bacterium RIFOXYD1_FULL_40_9 TaxID=1817731 RepID=A0A1F5FVB3_9BACT|nr:MAG: hypothetical protein A2572_00375 [Candidatus Collierbacteria bacterium RIFOXYD1_FULL_40_9]